MVATVAFVFAPGNVERAPSSAPDDVAAAVLAPTLDSARSVAAAKPRLPDSTLLLALWAVVALSVIDRRWRGGRGDRSADFALTEQQGRRPARRGPPAFLA